MASDVPAGAALSLRALQGLLYDLMTAPEGVAAGLAARGLPADALDGLIVGDVRLSAAARLDIYANMYFFRILDVLREEFPRVATALGADAFHNLITDYLLADRPAHPSLREAGARLPAYLRAHALGAERPWLAELAALERAHRELFDGADAEVLTLAALQALPPDAFATLPVRLIPTHRLACHAFDVSRSWEALAAGRDSDVTEPRPDPETLLIWRRETTVHHRAVGGAELAMLRHAAEPTTLVGLCEVFAREANRALPEPRDDAALAGEAFQILAGWVDDGLLAAG